MRFHLLLPAALAASIERPLTLGAQLQSTAVSGSSQVGVISFENVGFDGFYHQVESFSNIDKDSCLCSLLDERTHYNGTNAPLNEELSVHFRGPLKLHSFGYYVSSDYAQGQNGGEWTRKAHYDAASQTADNVTFLVNGGDESKCLGKALTYADADGVHTASLPQVLQKDNLIESDAEYIIYSNVLCGASGSGKDCGVYRPGIPAFHGFYGAVKMFLFEFEMPTGNGTLKQFYKYDMPAIWLLNAQIARTSEYLANALCLCWNSGCGEFDVFEVMNATETNHLYLTIHDYQGTGDINEGIMAYAHFPRARNGTMKGGVVFDLKSNAIVFLLDKVSVDGTVQGSLVNLWILDAGKQAQESLLSVTMGTALALALSTKSHLKKSGSDAVRATGLVALVSWLFSALLWV